MAQILFQISRFRLLTVLLLIALAATPAAWGQGQAVAYPASGNIRAEEGSLEFWFRLEAVPDGSDKEGLHHFPFVEIQAEGEEIPRVRLVYSTIWKAEHFHIFFSSVAKAVGKLTQNPYVASAEETQETTKADRGGVLYPRTPRLKPGDWHYLAATWTGTSTLEVTVWLDGKECILPAPLTAGNPLEDLGNGVIAISASPYRPHLTMDDLRISSVARTEKEIKDAFAAGALKADKFTLLFDRFENVREGEDTTPEVMAGDPDSRRGTFPAKDRWVEVVPGKTGQGLKTGNRPPPS